MDAKWGEGLGMNCETETEIDIYTLLYINQTTNENLLYSTGNSYSILYKNIYTGKESKKEEIYVYV